jgi:preprotein translocase subunit SecG
MYNVLLVIYTIIVLMLIGVILLQRSDQDGMGLSGGGNQFMTGRAQANLLTRITSILATIFILSSLALAIIVSNKPGASIVDQLSEGEAAPATAVETPAEPVEKAPEEPVVPKPE